MKIFRQVIFVTPVFSGGATGPATFAQYLWAAFRDDPEVEFHLVAPEFCGEHARWHASGPGTHSLDLYRRLADTALRLARQLGEPGRPVLVHVNNSNLHQSLLKYDGPLWGQVNDYENTDWWRRAGETIQRAGWRRFFALGRRRWLERRFIARQDLSLCNSEFTRRKILAEYRPPRPERVIVFPKAVDVEFFRRPSLPPADPLGRAMGSRRFIFAGSDLVRKGLDTLLLAVASLPTEFPWHLTVVGASRAEVVAAFPHLSFSGLEAKIHFAGKVDKERLRQMLWCSDVFVLPSRAEALGIVLLEAMAAGLSLVAANVGGIPEIIRHPAAGVLVRPDDPAALAQALAGVHLRRAGVLPATVQEILDYYSTSAMISRLRGLYLRAG